VNSISLRESFGEKVDLNNVILGESRMKPFGKPFDDKTDSWPDNLAGDGVGWSYFYTTTVLSLLRLYFGLPDDRDKRMGVLFLGLVCIAASPFTALIMGVVMVFAVLGGGIYVVAEIFNQWFSFTDGLK
jgi:hypothetical protein